MCVWYWLHWRCPTRWLLQVSCVIGFQVQKWTLSTGLPNNLFGKSQWQVADTWELMVWRACPFQTQFACCEWRADLEGNLVVHLSVYSHCSCFTTNSHSHFCSCLVSVPFPVYRRKSSGTVGWLKFTTISINMVRTHKVLVKIKNKSDLEMTYT